jgi:8-oxo-dGTP pyrophosphatase MutT (NUDIX family)
MKIDFKLPEDGLAHYYCPNCHSENFVKLQKPGASQYSCHDCHTISPRIIAMDPSVVWWVDPTSRELWHESVGTLISNERGEILLFDRIIYPFAYTIPAGHLEIGELPILAVKRETFEETGIIADNFELVTEEEIIGDECKWGADCHKWHLYRISVRSNIKIVINSEGKSPVWLKPPDALSLNLTKATRYFLERFGG